MPKQDKFKLVLGEGPKPIPVPRDARSVARVKPAKPTLEPQTVYKALKDTAGSNELIKQLPKLADFHLWLPTATFSVCMKTGTAMFLDIWDADHFDGFTDMQRCLTDCRAWFSADGYTFWDSPETKTGRINCFFNAPTAGTYVCNVELQSFSGSAAVECLIDNFNYGPLSFNGTKIQPHPATLSAGGHSFRIRQLAGSFFFIGLSVWKTG